MKKTYKTLKTQSNRQNKKLIEKIILIDSKKINKSKINNKIKYKMIMKNKKMNKTNPKSRYNPKKLMKFRLLLNPSMI